MGSGKYTLLRDAFLRPWEGVPPTAPTHCYLAKKKCMLRKHVLPHYTQDQFEDMECTSTQLQAFVISSLYEWSFVLGLTDSNSIHSFIDSIHM